MDKSTQEWADAMVTEPDYVTMVTYTADGVSDQYEFNFPGGYLSRDDIKAYMVDEVSGTRTDLTVTFVAAKLVKLAPAQPAGVKVTIYRDTPKELPLINFTDGAMIEARNLDRNAKQCIFAIAELLDRYNIVYQQVELAQLFAEAAQQAASQAAAQAALVAAIYERFQLTDAILAEMQETLIKTNAYATEAGASAEVAVEAASRAELAANVAVGLGNLYSTEAEMQAAITAGKIPDGGVAYILAAEDSTFAFPYRNVGGVITPILTSDGEQKGTLSSTYAINTRNIVYRLERVVEPIQVSPDSLFDIVSANGLRPFRVRSVDGVLEFESVAKLVTGDLGVNFGGSVIDNNAPPGWLFCIYSANGLLIAGVKSDGTKVGWGGDDNGGGENPGSGGVTPGDTAGSYDDIRAYTGEATVRDVVGVRIGGRFVVTPDDTLEDDNGGVLVGVDGRRWVRIADSVSFDMFSAPRIPESVYSDYVRLSKAGDTGTAQALLLTQEPADDAIDKCFKFAARFNIPVVQNTGRFLWVSKEIDVRVSAYLTGSTIVTCNRSGTDEVRWGHVDGVNDGAPEPMTMFVIRGKEAVHFTAEELQQLNTEYSQYLKRGSMELPMPKLRDYRGGMFAYISTENELYRSGNKTNPRTQVRIRDFSRIGRNGALSDVLVKNCPAGTVQEAWIQPKEDSFLQFNPPSFFEAGNGRKFQNIHVVRSQVRVDDIIVDNYASGNVESRVLLGSYGVTDVYCARAVAECHPSAAGGAYVICFRNSIEIHVDSYYGLYGWGFQGHHGLKRVFISNSVMNRFDFHSFGYDVYINGTKFKGKQVYLQGGGQFSLRDCESDVTFHSPTQEGHLEVRLDYFINMREDYAGDCEGNLSIENHVFRFDKNITAAWAAGTLSFDVVRLNSGAAVDYGIDTKTPNTIIGKNLVFDLDGMEASLPDNFAFTFCRPYRAVYSPGRKTYLPDMVKVSGMTAINVPANKNAMMAVFRCGADLYQSTFASRNAVKANGTNAEIIGEDVISVMNNHVIGVNACPMVYLPGNASSWDSVYNGTTYRASKFSYRPKVTLRNCNPVIVYATGAKAEFDISGGLLARFVTGEAENRCRVTGADIQLVPDASGTLYFDASYVRATGCDWFDPMSGATYTGTLRGIGNENRGTSEHSPNV